MIMTVHSLHHTVRAALHRQVDVTARRDRLCAITSINSPGAVLGVRGHEAQAVLSFDAVEPAQQFRKIAWFGQSPAIGIDILPEQGDLP